jgi:hypothetical protein
MAKAKAAVSKPVPKRGRPKAVAKTMKTLGYRVALPYLEWLEKVALANRSSISGLLDQSVVDRAVKLGVTDPPPKRTA